MPAPEHHVPFLACLPSYKIATHPCLSLSPVPNAGLGITASAPIPANTQIALTPRSALLNLTTLARFSAATAARRGTLNAHTLLALAVLDARSTPSHPWRYWLATFPRSFTSLPLLWPEPHQALLPRSTQQLLHGMQTRFRADLEAAAAALRDEVLDEAAFTWAWCAVNTRSLYFPAPRKPDAMTLCPFVDYFNHSRAAAACVVELTPRGYVVRTTAPMSEGEEVFVTYGAHSGDFLLVEYGFVPDGVEGDFLCVDPWMDFTPEQEKRLRERGYWGGYVVDAGGFCYRAETAGRVVGDEFLEGVLEKVEAEVREMRGQVEDMREEGVAKEILRRRWTQLGEIVGAAKVSMRSQ